jgi:hypothetical protein
MNIQTLSGQAQKVLDLHKKMLDSFIKDDSYLKLAIMAGLKDAYSIGVEEAFNNGYEAGFLKGKESPRVYAHAALVPKNELDASWVTPEMHEQITMFLTSGHKLEAVKFVKNTIPISLGWGLRESKDFIDNYK